MSKTNAEYCREYRQRKKENKIKMAAKSAAERVREFRGRQNLLWKVVNVSSATNSVILTDVNSESDHSKYSNIF